MHVAYFISESHINISLSYDCSNVRKRIKKLDLLKNPCRILSANVTWLQHCKELFVKTFISIGMIRMPFLPRLSISMLSTSRSTSTSRRVLGNSGGVVHSEPLLHSQVFEGHRPCGRETGASNRARDMAAQ